MKVDSSALLSDILMNYWYSICSRATVMRVMCAADSCSVKEKLPIIDFSFLLSEMSLPLAMFLQIYFRWVLSSRSRTLLSSLLNF